MTSPLERSSASFRRPSGETILERYEPYSAWQESRVASGVWPYARTMQCATNSRAAIGDNRSQQVVDCLNFSSQDYLALAQSPRVHQAAIIAIQEFGIHSAGSPALVGRTKPMVELESRLATIFDAEACTIFPTGWAAGFGVLTGLACAEDFILADALIHNCLAEGANHSQAKVSRFAHNDMSDLEAQLSKIRTSNPGRGIFVVTESLFSMDSDSPDLESFVRICKRFNAISILDVAHDFGAMGSQGFGLWGTTPIDLRPDIVMGSFSKTFASNGGFVVSNRKVIEYLKAFSTPWVFSNAISPIQASIVLACLDCVISEFGEQCRAKLFQNALHLRNCAQQSGFEVTGRPSPIVPIAVGKERVARLMSREIMKLGLAANLVEFPAVPLGKARFRFQLMSSHSDIEIEEAVRILSDARAMVRDQDS